MKNFFSIGEISRLFGINKKTLRYYDQIDLFKPSYVNKKNNYRYYTLDQFEYLETIIYLKELGLSLNKIKYHLNNANNLEVVSSLEEQTKIIKDKIKELKIIDQKINNKIIQIKDSMRMDLIDVIREVNFPERQVVQLRDSIRSDCEVGLSLRKLTQMFEKKINLSYGSVGVCIDKNNLINRKYGRYKSIFIMIQENDYDKNLIKIFKEGTYVCIRFNGIHKDTPPYYEKLINYINEKGYKIIDDSLEIELTDPSLSLSSEEVIMEIQILVDKN